MDFHLEMEMHYFLLDKYLQIIAKPVFMFLSSKVRRFTKKKSQQSLQVIPTLENS